MRISLFAIAICLPLTQACGGAGAHIAHDRLRYPVSLSGALPDARGNVHILGRNLEALGPLNLSWTVYGLLYGAQTKTIDISDDINQAIEALHGQGAVQVELTASTCWSNYVFPLNLLPFWPGCAMVEATGQIVRLKDVDRPDIVRDSVIAAGPKR